MKTLFVTSFIFIHLVVFNQNKTTFFQQLNNAAIALTKNKVIYNGGYFIIDYPNGDVPDGYGVCTDVVIRAYRKLGIDLQKEVHEDMKANFLLYPQKWGLKKPDTNIDHRRVPNLMTFFTRKGASLPINNNTENYLAGDVVCWDLGRGITHIGIVISQKSENGTPLIVHNIGNGQEISDSCLAIQLLGIIVIVNS